MITTQTGTLADRLDRVRERVGAAAREAGRDPAEITTIVVTKFHSAELVSELAALGVRDVGENRVLEAEAKSAAFAQAGLRWHLVGQLQTNKARRARGFAASVHSLDRPALADALRSDAGALECFLQLSLSEDPGRGGVAPSGLLPLAEHVLRTPGLRLVGVMAVAPLGVAPRAAFARVREASELLRTIAPEAVSISAGMSGDFEDAIAEGATHLRIGTAITGKRPVSA